MSSWKITKKLNHLSFGRSHTPSPQPVAEPVPTVPALPSSVAESDALANSTSAASSAAPTTTVGSASSSATVPSQTPISAPGPATTTASPAGWEGHALSRSPSSIAGSSTVISSGSSATQFNDTVHVDSKTGAVQPARSGTLVLTLHEGKELAPLASALAASTAARPSSAAGSHLEPARLTGRELPYALVDFDNQQIFVNAVSGDSKQAMWAGSSTHYKFDVSRTSRMNISLYYRNPTARVGDARRDDILIGKCSVTPTFEPAGLDGKADLSADWHDLSDGHGRLKVGVRFVQNSQQSLTIDDFELLKVVGKGSFGKVMQVKKRDTQRVYALKTIRKAHIISRSEVSHTLAERSVLAQINNPFIVPLKFSFQSPEKLYLVLAFVNGGELFHHLQREQRFDINRARFYAAELLCALECLHGFNVIYRDLKPENILLDYTGHIALCDFGLCKLNMKDEDRTNTFCGTPEYLAPELLTGGGYTKAVDWWTLGVLLYEMLVGLPPFYDENTNDMYQKILTESVHFPGSDVVPPAARDLLTRLLDKNAKNRLGYKEGATELKNHYFFTGIDWRKLLERKYEPSFKPNVTSQLDTSNFDREFTSEAPTDSYVEGPTLSQTVQQQFAGWSYNRPVAGLSDVGGSVRDPGMDHVVG